MRRWTAGEVEDFALADLENVQVHPDSLVILALLDEDHNLALGRSTVNELDREVPLTDGSIEIGQSEWLSGTPHVFGRNFTVDLGLDRAITRVRILAGESAQRQTEYFVARLPDRDGDPEQSEYLAAPGRKEGEFYTGHRYQCRLGLVGP